MKDVLKKVNEITVEGGSIYFMQREKNTEEVLKVLDKPDGLIQT